MSLRFVWEMLIQTPLYVYGIFAYLLIVGLRATKNRVVSYYKLSILVVVFFGLVNEYTDHF